MIKWGWGQYQVIGWEAKEKGEFEQVSNHR